MMITMITMINFDGEGEIIYALCTVLNGATDIPPFTMCIVRRIHDYISSVLEQPRQEGLIPGIQDRVPVGLE